MFVFWSISEAWDWLVHFPVLGFIMLILLAAIGGLASLVAIVHYIDSRQI